MKINWISVPWQTVTGSLLCAAALAFPFSVAATNISLGIVLGLGIFTGQLWLGIRQFQGKFPWLAVSMLAYLGLFVLGLVWSNDIQWGLHILARQWYWLLIPTIACVLDSRQWRNRFLIALSLGLVLHLAYCVLQMGGYVTVTVLGSAADNATGHIGHIGFGFVYGIWAAWLLHWGWQRSGMWRWGSWLLSMWAWVTIFLAEGRSGYLIALALISTVLWKHLLGGYNWRRLAVVAFSLLAVTALMVAGPGKDRVRSTMQSFHAFQHGDIEHAEPRWSLWIGAVEAWKLNPVLGVGTGGFPKAAIEVRAKRPDLNYGTATKEAAVAHPHNMYLLALARWGLWGLAALCMLLFVWVRTGWRLDWSRVQSGPLITFSGIALAVHGLSAVSFEDHFSGVLAALLLGLGLAELSAGNSNRYFHISQRKA